MTCGRPEYALVKAHCHNSQLSMAPSPGPCYGFDTARPGEAWRGPVALDTARHGKTWQGGGAGFAISKPLPAFAGFSASLAVAYRPFGNVAVSHSTIATYYWHGVLHGLGVAAGPLRHVSEKRL